MLIPYGTGTVPLYRYPTTYLLATYLTYGAELHFYLPPSLIIRISFAS